ncbi:hypothetical protein D0N36_14340 [Hymenobacter lapidiphilus]|nr:hypothetical protein D0N36_14340 [Hymenobacter sp. CCM 8763]
MLLLLSRAAVSQTAVDSTQVAAAPAAIILPKSDYRFSVIVEGGYMMALTNMANMNSFFRQYAIKREATGDPFVHYHGGGRYKRFKFLGQFGYGVNAYGPNERDALVVRRTYANNSGAMLGYDVLNDRNMRLYLNFGAGNLSYDYAVINRFNQTVAYTGSLARYSHNGDISSLKLDNPYWDLNVELSQREKRRANVGSVLRLGYRRGWQPSKWKSGPFVVDGFPADRISQLYLQVGFYVSSNFRPGK